MTHEEYRLRNQQIREQYKGEHLDMKIKNKFDSNNDGVLLALSIVLFAIAALIYILM